MKPLDWMINDNYKQDAVGSRTLILDAESADPASMQLLELGFPFAPPNLGWSITADDCLVKKGAPPLPPAAYAIHLGDKIYIYPFGYIAVVTLDGSFKLFHIKD